VRALLRSLADEGRTVFVSSHLMSEMAQTATKLIVVGRGKLLADCTVEEFVARTTTSSVTVRSPQADRLRDLLAGPDIAVAAQPDGALQVQGLSGEQIGTIAWQANLPIFELSVTNASLEEAFMQVTRDSVEYATSTSEAAR
jgi:ABC-2 type transport system ATP-binding protein